MKQKIPLNRRLPEKKYVSIDFLKKYTKLQTYCTHQYESFNKGTIAIGFVFGTIETNAIGFTQLTIWLPDALR